MDSKASMDCKPKTKRIVFNKVISSDEISLSKYYCRISIPDLMIRYGKNTVNLRIGFAL